MAEDKRTIVCNYMVGTSPVSKGSRAYVQMVPGDPERVLLLVRSRGGRHIEKWEHTNRLTNFRSKTVPDVHPLYEKLWGISNIEQELARLSLNDQVWAEYYRLHHGPKGDEA